MKTVTTSINLAGYAGTNVAASMLEATARPTSHYFRDIAFAQLKDGPAAEAIARFNEALGIKGIYDSQKTTCEKRTKELQAHRKEL